MKKRLMLLVIGTLTSLVGATRELIPSMKVCKNRMKCKIHPRIKDRYLTANFFVEYDEEINLESMDYAVLSLPVVLNLYSLVWFSGEDYYIDEMDTEVYHSLKKLKQVFKYMYPKSSWNGNIIPRKLVNLSEKYATIHANSRRRALLFSGGVDSTSSFYQHKDEDIELITAWGQFDIPLNDSMGWQGRKEKITSFAESFGKSTSFIRSNYSEMLDISVVKYLYPTISNWRIGTIEGMSWAGLTLPILIHKQCTHLYIASGIHWYFPVFDATSPFVEELMEFAGFRLVSDQFDMTRHDKTAFIVEQCKDGQKPFIKVCGYPNTNCGRCRKCCMTMMSLLGLGQNLADYGYNLTPHQAVHNTIRFFKNPIGRFDAWNFKEIQLKLRASCSPKTRSAMQPFLSYDMGTLLIDRRRKVTMGSWEELQQFNPSVQLPTNLSEELLNIEK